jgi:hypothetical protein
VAASAEEENISLALVPALTDATPLKLEARRNLLLTEEYVLRAAWQTNLAGSVIFCLVG